MLAIIIVMVIIFMEIQSYGLGMCDQCWDCSFADEMGILFRFQLTFSEGRGWREV